jgi:Ferredoxin-like domain in Api92-like protein
MPNWCNNSITLKHKDPTMIERAHKALADGRFLQEFIPVPKELSETVAGFKGEAEREAHEAQQVNNINKYGYKDWYDFCVSEWGTKWDVGGDDGLMQKLDANTLQASFDSAWSPPTSAYEKLCAQGFEIEAFYDEPGMAFCGKWTGNEDDYYDDYYEYGSETSETVRALIGEELDDHWGISDTMANYEEENKQDDQDLVDELERIRDIGPHTD